MLDFKFFKNNNSAWDLDKHVAVFCHSIRMFHQFHAQQRRMTGRQPDTNFLHSRFILDGTIFYFIGQPNDLNGLRFTHYYYYNFNVSENTWAAHYLIEMWTLQQYNEPNRINI